MATTTTTASAAAATTTTSTSVAVTSSTVAASSSSSAAASTTTSGSTTSSAAASSSSAASSAAASTSSATSATASTSTNSVSTSVYASTASNSTSVASSAATTSNHTTSTVVSSKSTAATSSTSQYISGENTSSSSGSKAKTLSTAAIGGIAGGIGGVVLVLLLVGLVWKRKKNARYRQENPLPPPRQVVHPGLSQSKSGLLSEKAMTGGNTRYDRGMSTLYAPSLPAHYPNYSKTRSSSGVGLQSSASYGYGNVLSYSNTSYAPSESDAHEAYTPPLNDYLGGDASLPPSPRSFGPRRPEAISRSSSPAIRTVPSNLSLGGMHPVDENDVTVPPGIVAASTGLYEGTDSRPHTPPPHGSRQESISSSRRQSRLPPPIHTNNLANSDVGSTYPPPSHYSNSAPSTPGRSRPSGFPRPYSSIRNSASGKVIALEMPAPLDASTPRSGYLPSARNSIYGLNDFGSYHQPQPGYASSSNSIARGHQGRRRSDRLGVGANGIEHQPSTSSSAPSTRDEGSGSGSGSGSRSESDGLDGAETQSRSVGIESDGNENEVVKRKGF